MNSNTNSDGNLKIFSPLDSNITIHGRTLLTEPLPLFWTASGVEFYTDASILAFDFETNFETREPWIRVEVDGASVLRMPLSKGTQRIFIWREMFSRTKHHVRLFKETQPMQRDPLSLLCLCSIVCNGNIYPVSPRPYRLEFIGDSISSGEGLAGSPLTKDGVSMVFSTYKHYALQTANALNADFRILSQSGWGLLAGWDNDRDKTMPPHYDKICSLIPGDKAASLGAQSMHDFSSWKPDIIIIHLGYNDGFALNEPAFSDGFQLIKTVYGLPDAHTSSLFIQTGVSFLRCLRQKNPSAQLVWTYGMFGNNMEGCIQETIKQYQKVFGDTVLYVPLPDTPPSQIASNNHPGPKSHTIVADCLTSALQPLLL